MFRGKESSNRIKLSGLVQDLLNFGVLGSLQLWGYGVGGCGWGWLGVGGWGWGWLGVPATHVHMHMHAHTHMHGKHDNFMQMPPPPPLGESLGIPDDVICAYMCMCVHAYVCMCTCVGGHPLTTPTHIHPPPTPKGSTPGISHNSIALELIKIFQFHLKI